MTAILSFLPVNEQMRASVAQVYGERNVKIQNGEIVVIKKPADKVLRPLIMGPEQLANKETIETLADYIIDNLNDDFEGLNKNEIIQNIVEEGLPSIYSELGIISKLQGMLSEFALNGNHRTHQRKVLCEDLLPLIIEKIDPYSCAFLNVDINLQQSIFSILKVGLQIREHGVEQAQESINNNAGAGLLMTAGQPILAMLDAYTSLASSHYTLPLHFTSASFHFLFDGVPTFSSEMRYSLQNMFQADQNPMLEDRDLKYSMSVKVELTHDYTWRYLRFSVDCVNNLMSYANNPFHFLNENDELIPEEQLQFFAAIYLLYADIASINHTTTKHIQYHLAFGAIEKVANLILGHIKNKKPKGKTSEIMGSNIAHIILSSSTSTEIQSIINENIGESKTDVSTNLEGLCEAQYSTLHKKLHTMFKEDESRNIANFYKFRNFYAHGSFLNHDMFKKTFLKTQARMPSEIVFIPYHLMLALSCNPERFFSYFQEQVYEYDYDKYRNKK